MFKLARHVWPAHSRCSCHLLPVTVVLPAQVSQLVFGLIIALFSLIAQFQLRPYLHPSDDSVASVFSLALVVFFSCLLVFKTQSLVDAFGVNSQLSVYVQSLYPHVG